MRDFLDDSQDEFDYAVEDAWLKYAVNEYD